MINVDNILQLQADTVIEWHNELIVKEEKLPWKFIEENHMWNFSLWHEEDIARIKDIDPLRIVEAKRNIDKYNQARNNAIEKIDEWILSYLEVAGTVPGEKMHSETPGMIIDRLSIMSLKRYHMNEETLREDASAEHKLLCGNKVKVLDEQISDLSNCLRLLLISLQAGELKFKVYRQFKMYNDPSLNPELYKREQQLNG
ncbi:DUF4254 domain-containing protein [Mucilaginibacter gynuensis]|uniref:DUF4254 domain-containing protein n=1 Tax=Mucilaginibacter gynuensis TaxID=1302236 RepID=A0ABP8G3F6_9SPHI